MTDALLFSLAKEFARESDLMKEHEATPIAEILGKTRQDMLSDLKAIGKSGSLEKIVAAEKSFVQNDLDNHTNSNSMSSSLNDALEELKAIETHIGIIGDSKEYQRINKTYEQHKLRDTQDLPKDGARHSFRSHGTRLGNNDRGRISDDEKAINQARQQNWKIAEKLYIGRQEKALGRKPGKPRISPKE
jgi:hypothetical protein